LCFKNVSFILVSYIFFHIKIKKPTHFSKRELQEFYFDRYELIVHILLPEYVFYNVSLIGLLRVNNAEMTGITADGFCFSAMAFEGPNVTIF